MNPKTASFLPKNRRGLSSVVGALFFTVLMIAGFSVLSLALDAQTDIVTTQRFVSDIEIKKQQEDFRILISTDPSNVLSVSVNNLGQNPVEISNIWIMNKTLPDQPAKSYDVNYDDAFIPSGFSSNVVSSQTLTMIPDTYDIKVLSSLGTIETAEFTVGSGSGSDLRAELITDPPDVIIGQNVTVAMLVTNTGSETIYNVQPSSLDVTGSGSVLSSTSHTPPFADLNGGASVMFSWDYQVVGNSGDQLIFAGNATGNGGASTSQVSDISILREPFDGGSGAFDPDIVNDELLAKPQLFFVIPSSQGESASAEALWGLNVVNPINAPMEVNKIVMTAFAPGGNTNDILFQRIGQSCTFNPISPVLGPDSNWSCPSENALMWKSTTPVIIPANSTRSFLTKVDPGSPSGNNGLESIIVQGSVFTTLGSFGKSGYQTTMSEVTTSIVNVHLTNDIADPRTSSKIQTIRTGIAPNSPQTFNVVLADMDTDDNTRITTGAKLIINVPKTWTNVIVTGDSGFAGTPSVTPFGDGSHQIVGVSNSEIGSTLNPAGTITFNATAPNIAGDKLYVMYVLAQGTTTNGFTIGPLAEIVLQVDG